MNRFKFFLAAIISGSMLFVTGCSSGNGYQIISQDEAAEMINDGATVVDVRTKEEYDEEHIPDAVLVPIEEIKAGNYDKLTDKNAVLLLYCRTGRRAEDAAEILAEAGYTSVYSFGGIVDWQGETVSE